MTDPTSPRIVSQTLDDVTRATWYDREQPTRRLLGCYGLDVRPADVDRVRAQIEHVLQDAIRTRDPERETGLLAALPERARMDSASIEILRGLGLSPVDVHIVTRMAGVGKFEAAGGQVTAMIRDGICRITAELAPGIAWRSRDRRTLSIPGSFPQTALRACVGRPLRDLIRHPATDGLDLIIGEIETGGGGSAYAVMSTAAEPIDLARIH